MVLHRRGRGFNSNVGGGRRRKPPQQQQQQQQITKRKRRRRGSLQSISDDNNSTDSSSTTRCVCGEFHNMGLMVQCDQCEVWQHCECMGLDQPNIPDHYYCEKCKPENHKIVSSHNGRVKRQYIATEKAPKKRMTLNSREASMSLEDVLAARNALEMYEAHKDDPTSDVIESDASIQQQKEVKEEEEEEEKPMNSKRKRELEIQVPDTIDEKSEPASSTPNTIVSQDEPVMTTTNQVIKEQVEKNNNINYNTLPTKPKASPAMTKKRGAVKNEKRANQDRRRGGKPRSRTSTPMRESSPMASSDISLNDTNHQYHHSDDNSNSNSSIATVLFDHFSPEARASSPPAKTRQPHVRMSLSEMNRRANQILEYISSIQVEMATKEDSEPVTAVVMNHAGRGLIQNTNVNGHDDNDDNDSLSSASTIPLEQESYHEEQTSLEIMDMLTRKLIQFQRRFGSSRDETTLHYRVSTRNSRESTYSSNSSNSNNNFVYRNIIA